MPSAGDFYRERIQPNNERQQALQDFRRQLDSDTTKLRNTNPPPPSEIRQIIQGATKKIAEFGIGLRYKEESDIKNLLSRLNEEINKGVFDVTSWRQFSYDAANCLQNIIKPAITDTGNIPAFSYPQSGATSNTLPSKQTTMSLEEERIPAPLSRHIQQLEEERARVEKLFRERDDARARLEAILQERDEERKEAWLAQTQLARTQDELQHTKAQLEEALAGATKFIEGGENPKKLRSLKQAKEALARSEAKAQEFRMELERLREVPYVPLLADAIPVLRAEYGRLTASGSESSPSADVPVLPVPLSRFCHDLLALCTEAEGIQQNPVAVWNPPLPRLDALVYAPVPPPTRLLAGAVQGTTAQEKERDTESWHRLYLLASRAQEWMHTVLTERVGITPLFPLRGDIINSQWHDSPDREVITTDDPALDGCVESLLRHGYMKQGTVLRRALVRRFRAVNAITETGRRA